MCLPYLYVKTHLGVDPTYINTVCKQLTSDFKQECNIRDGKDRNRMYGEYVLRYVYKIRKGYKLQRNRCDLEPLNEFLKVQPKVLPDTEKEVIARDSVRITVP